MNSSLLAAWVATVIALLGSLYLPEPWDIGSVVAASLCGAAGLLLFLAGRDRPTS